LILSHQEIVSLHNWREVISPFYPEKVVHAKTGTTYGCGACGYDIRIREDIWLGHGDFKLASALEYIDMPEDLAAFVTDKSSLARIGIAVQNTKIDPGWRGYLTLELSNHSLTPVHLIAGQPIAELTFQMLDQPTDRPYQGKYQDQPPHPVGALVEPSSAVTESPTISAIVEKKRVSGC